jgi:multidrug resistance protein, MATE family
LNSRRGLSRTTIIHIAWPIILANLSTPLLGLVDTAVIGNLGDPALIGAIAVGGMIFSFLYWGFGFLRMGTTGLVAQATGANLPGEAKATFYRALFIGTGIGALLLLLQYPLLSLALGLIDGSPAVESAALSYCQIRIWGAPISLAHLAVMGYLLGIQQTRALLALQLLLTGTNIVLDLLFVVVFDWGVPGVAAATVMAEILAMVAGLVIVRRHLLMQGESLSIPLAHLLDYTALTKMLIVNRDIMLRTLCLIFAFAWFTNEGAKSGDVLLATNAILMQFVSFSAFFLDGFALATESLIGQATGTRSAQQVNQILIYSAELGFATSFLLTLVFWLTGSVIIAGLTNVEAVRASCEIYWLWAVFAPPVSVACYLLDGAFIGATRTAEMRNAMIASLAVYLTAWWGFESLANHGLWLALYIYFIARAVTLLAYLPRLKLFTGTP